MLSLSRCCRLPRAATRPSRTLSSASALHLALKRHAPLDIHPEVDDAITSNKPIVALETALVTHGVPFPENLELATSLENIVRSAGAIPATIGLVGGRVKIGMDTNHLEILADTAVSNPVKVSRRDIGPAIATKANGGTHPPMLILYGCSSWHVPQGLLAALLSYSRPLVESRFFNSMRYLLLSQLIYSIKVFATGGLVFVTSSLNGSDPKQARGCTSRWTGL